MYRFVIAGFLMLGLMPMARAQQPQPDVEVLQSQRNDALDTVAKLGTMLKAERQAAAKREKDWADYSAPLWQEKRP